MAMSTGESRARSSCSQELLLQGLAAAVAEVGVALIVPRPGSVGNAGRGLAPGLVGNLDLGFLALVALGGGFAVESA
ncbi:MAG: hypothetical protein V9F00_14580 [Nocardioides sp.]